VLILENFVSDESFVESKILVLVLVFFGLSLGGLGILFRFLGFLWDRLGFVFALSFLLRLGESFRVVLFELFLGSFSDLGGSDGGERGVW
jgi:hypothetical protein